MYLLLLAEGQILNSAILSLILTALPERTNKRICVTHSENCVIQHLTFTNDW